MHRFFRRFCALLLIAVPTFVGHGDASFAHHPTVQHGHHVKPTPAPTTPAPTQTPTSTPTTAPTPPVTPIPTPTSTPPLATSTIPGATTYPGYSLVLAEDFNTPAAEGQFGAKYPGWNGYDGIQDGNVQGLTWESAQVSVANSVLTMRNSGGKAHAQAITPVTPGTPFYSMAQKYGKYSIRMKAHGDEGYKIAFLLWPTSGNWNEGEVDFPEGDIVGGTMTANSHNVTGNPVDGDYADSGVRLDDGKWHTFTITWTPTSVQFDADGKVFHTTTDPKYLPTHNMRWDLQAETSAGQRVAGTGYVDIDWVAQYKKD